MYIVKFINNIGITEHRAFDNEQDAVAYADEVTESRYAAAKVTIEHTDSNGGQHED